MSLKYSINHKLIFCLSLVLSLSGIFTGYASAAIKKSTETKNLDHQFSLMSTSSENIVLGKVISLSSSWKGNLIVTTAVIEPLETLKGAQTNKPLNVSYIGGTVGVINQRLSEQVTLNIDDVAILFLKDAPTKSVLSGSKVFSYSNGKIPLLTSGEDISKLKNNNRLSSLINNVRQQIQ